MLCFTFFNYFVTVAAEKAQRVSFKAGAPHFLHSREEEKVPYMVAEWGSQEVADELLSYLGSNFLVPDSSTAVVVLSPEEFEKPFLSQRESL